MPRVPGNPDYTPYPDQGPSNIPSPELRRTVLPEAFGVNIGQAVESLGGSVAHAGDELFNRAIAIQDLQNETDAANKNAQYMVQLGELHAQFNAKEGNDRVQAAPKYFKDVQDLRTQMRESLPSNNARRMFDRASLGTMGHTIFNGAGATATAQRKYVKDTNEAVSELNVRTAATYPYDQNLFEDNLRKNVENAKQASRDAGNLPGDANEDYMIRAAESKMRYSRLEAIAREQPHLAEQMLEKEKDRMLQPELKNITGIIRSTTLNIDGAMLAKDVYDAGQGDGTKPPMSLKQMEDEVRTQAAARSKNPLLPNHAVKELAALYNQDKFAAHREQVSNEQIVMEAIQKGKSAPEIMADPKTSVAYHALPPDSFLKKTPLTKNVSTYATKSQAEQRDAEWFRLRGLASNDVNAFLKENIPAANIEPGKRDELMKIRQGIMKQAGGDLRIQPAMRDLRGKWGTEMEALGLGRYTEKNKDAYNTFTGYLSDALDAWQASKGKAATPQEIRDVIGPQMIQKVASPGFLKYGPLLGPMFGKKEGESIFPDQQPWYKVDTTTKDYKDFEKETKSAIGERGGQEATDEQMQRAYNAMRFNRLWGAKKSNKE